MNISFFQIEIGESIYFNNNRIEEWKIKIKKFNHKPPYFFFPITLKERIYGEWKKEKEEIILQYQNGVPQSFLTIPNIKFALRISDVDFRSNNKMIIGLEITFNLRRSQSKI